MPKTKITPKPIEPEDVPSHATDKLISVLWVIIRLIFFSGILTYLCPEEHWFYGSQWSMNSKYGFLVLCNLIGILEIPYILITTLIA